MQRWHFQCQRQQNQLWECLCLLDWLHHLFKSNKLHKNKLRFCNQSSNLYLNFCNTGDISYYDLNKCYSFYTMCNWIMWSSLKPVQHYLPFSRQKIPAYDWKEHTQILGQVRFGKKSQVANHKRGYQFPETRIQALRNSFFWAHKTEF